MGQNQRGITRFCAFVLRGRVDLFNTGGFARLPTFG
jgi:hypothetical protein